MGSAFSGAKRTCEMLWNFSTSRSIATQQEEPTPPTEGDLAAEPLGVPKDSKIEIPYEEREELILKDDAAKKVREHVTFELQELRKTIAQLSNDLQEPLVEADLLTEDYKRRFTPLDDYVHESMYALLMWLSTKEQFKTLSMSQLMFFLKSPHIRQRKHYILAVERILRMVGLSVFDSDLKTEAAELAKSFDITRKKEAQITDPEKKKLTRLSMEKNKRASENIDLKALQWVEVDTTLARADDY